MKKLENMMLNRRQALALGVSGAASLALAACGGGSDGGASAGGDEKVDVTVTVWGPQEDQSDDNGKWLQTQCEAFAAAHPEWTITFKYGVCPEGDAKTNIGTDPSAGADVYMYANDQIPDLLKAGGIAELGGSTLDAIKANNSETTVNTVTYDGSVYGVPFTGNTLVANKNFANGDVGTNADAKAFFSGTWDYQKAVDAYGDNLGIAAAPSITIDGELKQMKAFAGSKAVGVNPATALYGTHPEVAVALAAYLGGTDAQQAHYELRSIIPTDTNITVDDALAQAQMDAMDFASIVQPLQADMSNYWTPAESMGKELVAGTVTHKNAAEKTEAMNTSMNTSAVQ